MNRQRKEISREGRRLAEDARAMMAATADVAGEKVGEIRERLAATLAQDHEVHGRVRDRVAAGTRIADRAMHKHPYQATAIGVGCGALIGFLIAHSCSSNNG